MGPLDPEPRWLAPFLVGLLLNGLAGAGLMRGLGVRLARPSERVFVGLVAGLTLHATAALVLGWLGLSLGAVVAAVSLASAAILLARARWRWPARRLPVELGLISLAFVAAAACVPRLGAVRWRGDELVVSTYLDHLFHASIVHELLRAVPPRQMPFFAGERFWSYHFYGDVSDAVVSLVGGWHPLAVHLGGGGLLIWFLMVLGLTVTARRLARSLLGAPVLTFLFLGGVTLEDASRRYLSDNTPAVFGVAVLTAVVLLLWPRPRPSDGRVRLAGFLAGGLYFYKANFFLVAAPAVAAVGVVWLIGREPRRMLWLALGGVAGAVGPLAWHAMSPRRAGGIGFEYGLYMRYLAGLQSLELSTSPWGPALYFVQWLVTEVSGPCAALALLGVLARRLRPRARVRGDLAASVGLAVGAVTWAVVMLWLVESGTGRFTAWNVAGHTVVLVPIFGLSLATWGLGAVAERLRPWRTWLLAAASLATLVSALVFDANPRGERALGPELSRAMVALARTPTDAVVLSAQLTDGPTFLSALSGRRVVLERVNTFRSFFASIPQRERDVADIHDREDTGRVEALLDAYRVTHMLVGVDRPLRAPIDAAVIVDGAQYRVLRRGAPASAPPGLP